MLGNAAIVEAVTSFLRGLRVERGDSALRIVVDPVLIATSGAALLEDEAVAVLLRDLVPLADVLTPNLPEAARLLGRDPAEAPRWGRDAQVDAARSLRELGPRSVLVKGGHRVEGPAADVLVTPEREVWLEAARVGARSLHGTGCTLSAAVTACLARGDAVEAAVRHAKEYLTSAIHRGLELPHPGGA
jgi:hydroxymethylpyrimidine/phosphomethylpyrimidine kinase